MLYLDFGPHLQEEEGTKKGKDFGAALGMDYNGF